MDKLSAETTLVIPQEAPDYYPLADRLERHRLQNDYTHERLAGLISSVTGKEIGTETIRRFCRKSERCFHRSTVWKIQRYLERINA